MDQLWDLTEYDCSTHPTDHPAKFKSDRLLELQMKGFEWRATRVVDPGNQEMLAEYDPTPSQAREFLSAIEELLLWLQRNYA